MAFHRGKRTVSCFSFNWPVTFSLCWLLSAVHSCGSQAKWNVKVFLKCMHLFFLPAVAGRDRKNVQTTRHTRHLPDLSYQTRRTVVSAVFKRGKNMTSMSPRKRKFNVELASSIQFNLQFSPQCQLKPWMANEDTEFNSRIHQVEVISPESCDVAESASRLCSSTVSWTASLRKKNIGRGWEVGVLFRFTRSTVVRLTQSQYGVVGSVNRTGQKDWRKGRRLKTTF